ncbi:transposase family protein [Streptomyces sp. NPDC058434]|uniref:transposase family protein n=1 Tax=Streptomyces sp. NPDC058434 TaxID=3346498 RepID=UPI00364C42E4
MLVYPSGVDVSSSTLRFLAQQLRRHRRAIGSRWRRLSAGRQALLTLAHLRMGHTYAQLAAGFGIGTTTAHRYVAEAVELLAALAPGLTDAVRTASAKAYLILDGTLLPIDRIAADRPFYSGKHRKHGMNVQIIADPFGRLLWASPALPGAVHDRHPRGPRTPHRRRPGRGRHPVLGRQGIPRCRRHGPHPVLGTMGWETLSAGQQAVNRSHAKIRALVEQAVATLKSWRLLRKLRCSTTRITSLVQAVLTLHLTSSE